MLSVQLSRGSGVPLARQIAAAVRRAMERGEVGPGARLPAERALARSLGVDRMTVARAYEELVSEGLVERQVGRGSFVSETLSPGSSDPEGAGPASSILHWTDTFASRAGSISPQLLGTLHAPAPESSINLSSLFPDPSLFPLKEFREAMDLVLRREGERLLGYGAASGYLPLRRYLAKSLQKEGMEVTPEEIVVTNGSQQGIDLVARAFLDPGDRVVLEDPTYTGAVQVFQSHGAQVAGTPVDSQGMVPERLEEVLRRRGARLIYLIPNFQNPTSGTMDLERRTRLLEVALRYGVPILEDDFGGDLRYEGQRQPSLRALDHGSEGVIYLSTFAKKLVPGLRIGWLAAPPEAARRLSYMKQVTDWSTSPLLQGALYEFCRRGHLDRHLKRVVREYRRRRDVMIASMERHFPREVHWTRPQGGLVIWVTLPAGVDSDEAATEAGAQGVLVGRGDLFSVSGGSRNNLRLVFGQASSEAIRKGIRILGTILKRKVKEAGGAVWPGAPEPLPII